MQPVLGAADADVRLMGAASPEAGGEAWGYRQLPRNVPPPVVDGRPLEFGPGEEDRAACVPALHARNRMALRADTAGRAGQPHRAARFPNRRSARVTAAGGGAARRPRPLPAGRQPGHGARAAIRAGGSARCPRPPGPTCSRRGEALAADEGTGRLAVTAFDRGRQDRGVLRRAGPAPGGARGRLLGRRGLAPRADRGARSMARRDAGARHLRDRRRTTPGWSRASSVLRRPRPVAVRARRRRRAALARAQPRATARSRKRDRRRHGLEDDRAARRRRAADHRHRATACGSTGASTRPPRTGPLHTFTLYFDHGAGARDRHVVRRDRHVAARRSAPIRSTRGSRRRAGIGYRSFAWAGDGLRHPRRSPTRSSRAATARRTGAHTCGSRARRSSGCRAAAATSAPAARSARSTRAGSRARSTSPATPSPSQLRDSWPVSARGPLTSVTPGPGERAGRHRRAGARGRARRHACCATARARAGCASSCSPRPAPS